MTDTSPQRLLAIAGIFSKNISALTVARLGNGHIHDTWLVTLADGTAMVLQRLNETVFPAIDTVIANVNAVLGHLAAHTAPPMTSPPLITTAEGAPGMRTAEGYFRAFPYLSDTVCHDSLPSPEAGYQAALGFAGFVTALSDYTGPQLQPAIPGFHDISRYIDVLRQRAKADPCGRLDSCRELLQQILDRAALANAFATAGLRPRLIHGDTKINNILLDSDTGVAVAVIDLDTVMTASPVLDFGDLVRTCISPAAEDEPDHSQIEVRLPIFSALADGYQTGCGDMLSENERSWLGRAGELLALEMAVRFLADHLIGDTYFRVHHPGHNLQRAHAQFALLQQLEKHRPALAAAIHACGGNRHPHSHI